MGQWGALGYALAGTSYQSILEHYYGGTSLAALNPAQEAQPGVGGHDRDRRQLDHRDVGVGVQRGAGMR